ncbi:MAG: ATPase [Synergistaceae bacterium]|jgi:V/A-type H+-transporting ATPase subunit E|nr:ATPase [Synergistaceae bacterium]
MNEVTNEKIAALQGIILEHANAQRAALASDARREAEAWLSKEMAKLDRETLAVIADAKARSEDIYRRQILQAEREKSTEVLRQQNMFLNEALKKFQDGLVHLRDRPDYDKILTALAASAVRNLKSPAPVRLRLAALDAHLGERIVNAVNSKIPDAGMVFEGDPAPIIGGCWVQSADGRRQVNADWLSRTQEAADILAERLLPLL